MVLGERFVLKHHFNGVPKSDDFEFVKEKLPLLKDGEILVDAKFLSVDPYLRPLSQTMNPPFTMVGSGVYEVMEYCRLCQREWEKPCLMREWP